MTGHNEVVLVIFDPENIKYKDLLKIFWQAHDPTQGMRQCNDAGARYRSSIYTFTEEQQTIAAETQKVFQKAILQAGKPAITAEIFSAPDFYYAEDYHQQYLAKSPNG